MARMIAWRPTNTSPDELSVCGIRHRGCMQSEGLCIDKGPTTQTLHLTIVRHYHGPPALSSAR
jgi:hypothetical protein